MLKLFSKKSKQIERQFQVCLREGCHVMADIHHRGPIESPLSENCISSRCGHKLRSIPQCDAHIQAHPLEWAQIAQFGQDGRQGWSFWLNDVAQAFERGEQLSARAKGWISRAAGRNDDPIKLFFFFFPILGKANGEVTSHYEESN